MKTPTKGDIVTPRNYVHRFTFEKEYTVESVSGNYIVLKNDKGFLQECKVEDFTFLQEYKTLESITAFILIATVLFSVAVLVASYLFEDI